MIKRDEIIMGIAQGIMSIFDDESSNDFHFKLDELDPTELFTDMVKACNFVYGQLTNNESSNFEFTHICNQLIVQDILEAKEEE